MVSVYNCGDVMTDVLVCFGYPSEDEISAVHRFDSDIKILIVGPNTTPNSWSYVNRKYLRKVIIYRRSFFGTNFVDNFCAEIAQKKFEVVGVVCVSAWEGSNFPMLAAELAAALALFGPDPSALDYVRDKFLASKLLLSFGYNVPKTYDNWESIDWRSRCENSLFVIKPRTASGGSKDVEVFDKESILNGKDAKLVSLDFTKFFIEEYVEGNLISVDSFSSSDEYVPFGVMLKSISSGKYRVEMGGVYASPNSHRWKKYNDIQRALIKDLNLGNCFMHVEYLEDSNNNVYIIDINPRVGGGPVKELCKKSYGFDLSEALISASIARRRLVTSSQKYRPFAVAAIYSDFYSYFDGYFLDKSVDVSSWKSVSLSHELVKRGTLIGFPHSNRDRLGFVFGESECSIDFDTLEESLESLRSLVKIRWTRFDK